MDLTLFDILAAGLVIRLRTIVQASTGLGAGLVVVPLLALIHIEFVPCPVIFARLILSSFMTDGGPHHFYGQRAGSHRKKCALRSCEGELLYSFAARAAPTIIRRRLAIRPTMRRHLSSSLSTVLF